MKLSLCRRLAVFMMAVIMLLPSLAGAAADLGPLFDEALANLLTPAQLGEQTGTYELHTGDSAYAPCVNPGIIPYDEQAEFVYLPPRTKTL